jgi:hypothetical protein
MINEFGYLILNHKDKAFNRIFFICSIVLSRLIPQSRISNNSYTFPQTALLVLLAAAAGAWIVAADISVWIWRYFIACYLMNNLLTFFVLLPTCFSYFVYNPIFPTNGWKQIFDL